MAELRNNIGLNEEHDISIAELFQKAGSVSDGMAALAGKTVVVSDVVEVRTLRYGTTSLMNAQIPTIDLVD